MNKPLAPLGKRKSAKNVEDSEEFAAALQFRDVLLQGTTARSVENITRIWTVCEEMMRASTPITVAEVGRRLKQRFGGPTTQSIRDQPDRLKRLVELCAAVVEAHGPKRHRNGDGDFLALIPDQTARAQVKLLMEQCDKLGKEVKALRRAFTRLSPLKGLTADQCYADIPASVPEVLTGPKFDDAERKAVAKFLDGDFLFDEGLRIDEGTGLIKDESNRLLLGFPFITALRKIAGL